LQLNTINTSENEKAFLAALSEDIKQNSAKAETSPADQKLAMLSLYDPLEYGYNDRGTSELFSELYRDELKYNTTAKEWYYYNGTVWVKDVLSEKCIMKRCWASGRQLRNISPNIRKYTHFWQGRQDRTYSSRELKQENKNIGRNTYAGKDFENESRTCRLHRKDKQQLH